MKREVPAPGNIGIDPGAGALGGFRTWDGGMLELAGAFGRELDAVREEHVRTAPARRRARTEHGARQHHPEVPRSWNGLGGLVGY